MQDETHKPSGTAGLRVVISELSPQEESEWDRFVIASESGTFFHLCGWKHAVEQTLGHRCIYLVARRNSDITGVFPVAQISNRVFGDCLVSLPLAVYGGICADDAESYAALLKAGSGLAVDLGVKYLEMRNRTEPFPTSLPGRDLYVTFGQDLTAGPTRLFERLPKKTRYAIRTGVKADLKWTETDRLDELYEIYAHNVHRLGTPVFPKKLFEVLRCNLRDCWRVFLVRKEGRAVAGAFCWYFKGTVMPYYVGSLSEAYRYSPNNFMYWKLIEQSCADGLKWFDFGRSKRNTGSFSFKVSWSMNMQELPYRYQLVRSPEVPHLSAADSTFQLPIAVWKRLPFGLTKVLGPRVIRWVPSV